MCTYDNEQNKFRIFKVVLFKLNYTIVHQLSYITYKYPNPRSINTIVEISSDSDSDFINSIINSSSGNGSSGDSDNSDDKYYTYTYHRSN